MTSWGSNPSGSAGLESLNNPAYVFYEDAKAKILLNEMWSILARDSIWLPSAVNLGY
ncbi:MAG: hypothetical protein M0T78_03020 [Actinomycetota bacterium]|nr:hypothetical protein [Actinomycetota bacterium]